MVSRTHPPTMRQQRLPLARSGAYEREAYVEGRSNTEAVRVVSSWTTWPTGCLVIVGPEGAGKTHLARIWARDANALVLDRQAPDISSATGRPVLLEDADQGVPDEALFHLVNLAGRMDTRLLLTARRPPLQWETTLPDLRSRLNTVPVVEIEAPDDTVLEGVLRRFFRDRHIRPPETVYPYLLSRMGRSIPDAAEIVRRLDEAGDVGFRPVTRTLARQILEDTSDLFE